MASERVEPIRECPTCGVDAARAMVVSACAAFYRPEWRCPKDGLRFATMQGAADHLATHEPDVVDFVRRWIEDTATTYRVRCTRD